MVIMLEPMSADKEFEIWPRHITIVPWFPCDDDSRLDETLAEVTTRHEKFIVKAGRVEEWGRKEKFMVQMIDDDDELQRLHRDIFGSLEKNDFPIHQKDFLGEKYTPHISLRNHLQKGRPLSAGREIIISNFTLVKQLRLKGSGRMIKSAVKDYELKS